MGAKKKSPVNVARVECIEDVIIVGRTDDTTPDHCFIANKVYHFVIAKKKGKDDYFTMDEVGQGHYIGSPASSYFPQHFRLLDTFTTDDMTDHVLAQRMIRIAREKHHYTEPE